MIKKYNGFEAKKAGGAKFPELPVGGYVCKVMNAEVTSGMYGDQLIVSYDVAEGENKDFWRKAYAEDSRPDKKWGGVMYLNIPDENTEQKKRIAFENFAYALEDSNAGYHWDWDETKLKGKMLGIIVSEKEKWSKDHTKIFTNTYAYGAASIDDIRSSNYKIPDIWKVKDGGNSSVTPASTFPTFSEVMDDGADLPF